ncbi:MAG: GH92 family glycosyl hydrolase [Bacteroidales bacterium]|nr:GH92 family glycosyl hydrolase [Bacteroidales bacterium]
MKKTIIIAVCILSLAGLKAQSEYVNPFVGTDGHGHTYPGAIVPFGAVQLSPDTRLGGWDGCSGYHYSDSRIYGFSHTHLNGTGVEDYCDILVTPFLGEPSVLNESYALPFSHENEKASPGYYSVKFDNGVNAEMTASKYVGVHRYTFPRKGKRGVIVDLKHRDKTLESYMTLKANDLVGFRRSESWSTDQYCAFSLKTSVVPSEIVYYVDDKPVNLKEVKGTNCKAVLYFDENVDKVVVKVAISAVDIDGAVNNQTEVKDFDFDKVRKAAKSEWDKELGKIQVNSKNTEYMKVFYTALYHCFTSPYLYSDLDGRYRASDNKIYKKKTGHDVYTVFSLWDTYRALHPLLNIIDQKRSADFIYTFLDQYRHSGYLPMWELSSFETWCMIGYHAVPVVLDTYMKGIRGFDTRTMLNAMIETANLKKLGRPEYAKYGYVPGDMENESVSKTLEYAYDDWCIAMFAKEIGEKAVYDEYIRRAQSYKNIIDDNGFMRGRMNGGFVVPFNPREVNNFYTEANSWQYSTYVPHDFSGYRTMLGGNKAVEVFLDRLFTSTSEMAGRVQSDITGTIGQYAHGNEPSHHAAYLYNFIGKPQKTQKYVKRILTELYSSKPDGLCGNEDCGQMSAWYVFSSLGFYPVCPGNNQYVIGYPLFDKAVVNLENGKSFEISRKNEGSYIVSATLNGKPLNRSYITYEEISEGGVLEFKMGDEPGKDFGTSSKNVPVTKISPKESIIPVPVFSTDKMSFQDKTVVSLSVPLAGGRSLDKNKSLRSDSKKEVRTGSGNSGMRIAGKVPEHEENVKIIYTTDGSEPTMNHGTVYEKPITVDRDMTVKAIACVGNIVRSNVAEAKYVRYTRDKDITYVTKPDPQYYAGGDVGLIDNLRGTENYRIGGWQGFTGDFEAVIDLHGLRDIESVSLGFLEEQRSWIFYPRSVDVFVSEDGRNYKQFGNFSFRDQGKTEGANIREAGVQGTARARYVKVVVKNYGKLPEWHISAGEPAWLFIDEITVR